MLKGIAPAINAELMHAMVTSWSSATSIILPRRLGVTRPAIVRFATFFCRRYYQSEFRNEIDKREKATLATWRCS
jgi:hypothetical protein